MKPLIGKPCTTLQAWSALIILNLFSFDFSARLRKALKNDKYTFRAVFFKLPKTASIYSYTLKTSVKCHITNVTFNFQTP